MTESIRRLVVGTAGHIDHGKTSLVAALTGIDCDRWQEEKDRGITIDLGFAHLRHEGLQIGIVDVPGHERFLHNALAGLGGIDFMMLVVAADEGIKPQTREHLAICSLLDIPAGLAVLSKSDLVDDELLDIAELELGEALEGTPFAAAPIVRASSTTGAGIADLKARLIALAEDVESSARRLERPVRLPIDRAFQLRGLGVVVTGTLQSGRLSVGDELHLLPEGRPVRVRSLEVHGEERGEAAAGERTSVQLAGIAKQDVERGHQLVWPEAFCTSRSLLARYTHLEEAPAEVAGLVPVRFHHTTSERLGKMRPVDRDVIEPGETGLVEVRLDRPVVATRGDRFIIRRPSPQSTLGGGEILDPRWLSLRGARRRQMAAAVSGSLAEALVAWASVRGASGLEVSQLSQWLGESPAEALRQIEPLVAAGQLLNVGSSGPYVTVESVRQLATTAKAVLEEHYRKDRTSLGMPKAELLRRLLPRRALSLAEVYLEWLRRDGVLAVDSDRARPAGRSSELEGADSALARQIERAFASGGLSPPSPQETCERLGAKRQIFDGVLRHLLAKKALVRLPGDLIVAASSLDELRRSLLGSGWDSFSVAEFKERFGLSRKWAIPLLEYLDSRRITQRQGDRRLILRAPAS